jgi:hypothetical protein
VIFALAIAGASLLTVFAVWMLILFISTAIADHGYVGKHRYADKPSSPRHRTPPRTYPARPAQVHR